MKRKTAATGDAALRAWAKDYRAAAKRDGFAMLTERLEIIGFVASLAPEVVENTIRRVALVCAFAQMDGRDITATFLPMQTYDFAKSTARYMMRLEPYEVAFLLFDEKADIDLADLYEAPPGYIHLYVDHVDGTPFSKKEFTRLAREIREDYAYDFEPDELTLEIDAGAGGIQVSACDAGDDPPWR